jgi:hypothetical protein
MKQIQIVGEYTKEVDSIFKGEESFGVETKHEFPTFYLTGTVVEHILSSDNPLASYLRSIFVCFDGATALMHTRKLLSFVDFIENVSGTIHINGVEDASVDLVPKSHLNS